MWPSLVASTPRTAGEWEPYCDGGDRVDAVLACNVTHISPWRVTTGLVAGAGAALKPGGRFFLYGPFKVGGQFTTESNEAFDSVSAGENTRLPRTSSA